MHVKKAIKHDTKAFLLFVDLRKAYSSVPREAMWLVLIKHSVPMKLVNLPFMKICKLGSLLVIVFIR